jgi:putative phosphoesterase
MRIGILSDTHGRLHPLIYDHFAQVDVILHAGDVEDLQILDDLRELGEVHAVAGNCDFPSPYLPPVWTGIYGGLRIAMTHGHYLPPASTMEDALVNLFADFQPHLIVHGHTHQARLDRHHSGVQILNPGAACPPRFGSTGSSVCLLDTGIPGRAGDGPVFAFRELHYPSRG